MEDYISTPSKSDRSPHSMDGAMIIHQRNNDFEWLSNLMTGRDYTIRTTDILALWVMSSHHSSPTTHSSGFVVRHLASLPPSIMMLVLLTLDMEEVKMCLSIPISALKTHKFGPLAYQTQRSSSVKALLEYNSSKDLVSCVFDSILNLESRFEKIGVEDGLKRGTYIGEAEGLWHGVIRGFDTNAEAAYYWGVAAVWLSVLDWLPNLDKKFFKTRIATKLHALRELSYSVLLCENPNTMDCDVIATLDRARSKYTVLSKNLDKFTNQSIPLLLPMEYNVWDKGCASSFGY